MSRDYPTTAKNKKDPLKQSNLLGSAWTIAQPVRRLLACSFALLSLATTSFPALALVRASAAPHLNMPNRQATSRYATAAYPHRHAYAARFAALNGKMKKSKHLKIKLARGKVKKPVTHIVSQPQLFVDKLISADIAPGVVHKSYRGALNIQVIDIDMRHARVKVQPAMAGNVFDELKNVSDHAKINKAMAAVNANYFKKDGTPLGTLIINGEWVAGPLYDRASMGITEDGEIKMDRVSLSGTLTSSNAAIPHIWVNNINQPRRSGCHLIVYTGRWGNLVRLPYAGTLVSVNAQGEVVAHHPTVMSIPPGGFVLSDSKNSPIAALCPGDKVQLNWQPHPDDWQDVVEAVSGGPILIKNGRLFVDLKDEKFRRSWTGSQITARTMAGVTANRHLLLVTIEGAHTLWDAAKFLQKLGADNAMNLDGGGSTAMVVNGQLVTRNSHQRRVASSLLVLDSRNSEAVRQAMKPLKMLPEPIAQDAEQSALAVDDKVTAVMPKSMSEPAPVDNSSEAAK